MDSYQILVFENQEIYDSLYVSADKAVEEYVERCQYNLPPDCIPRDYTSFDSDKMFVKYSDRCGNDKPMMVLMIGPTTPEMIDSIREGLRMLYVTYCAECGEEIDSAWRLCRECRNK